MNITRSFLDALETIDRPITGIELAALLRVEAQEQYRHQHEWAVTAEADITCVPTPKHPSEK